MTTSHQPRHGRHARLGEPDGRTPPEPSSASLPEPRSAPWSEPSLPQVPPPDGTARPRSVGEYVAQLRESGPSEPGFGEWPYGARKAEQDAEPVGPNPYLPCEEGAPEVRLAPGGLPGTLALLAGLAGLGLALMIPIIAIAVWPLTILGLVLGVVGLRRIRSGGARNSLAAVTGVVLSTAGLAVCVVWLSMYAAAGVGTAGPAVDQGAVPAAVR